MKRRNTKQKEIVLDVLKENKIHPDIQEIIKLVHEKDNSIGQATIYRNIHKLIEEHKVIEIPTEGVNRYDYYDAKHYHLYCKNCKKIIDIYNQEIIKAIEKLKKNKNIDVIIEDTLLLGVCNRCKESEEI